MAEQFTSVHYKVYTSIEDRLFEKDNSPTEKQNYKKWKKKNFKPHCILAIIKKDGSMYEKQKQKSYRNN